MVDGEEFEGCREMKDVGEGDRLREIARQLIGVAQIARRNVESGVVTLVGERVKEEMAEERDSVAMLLYWTIGAAAVINGLANLMEECEKDNE